MKNIKTHFSFQGVGQGGFYTGRIWRELNKERQEFNFVYDCGTQSRRSFLEEKITCFKGYSRNSKKLNKLHTLFISHLDDDHVNGINSLLLDIECDNVYLPYMTPLERLFLAIIYDSNNGDDNGGNPPQAPEGGNPFDFIDFLASPHGYLLRDDFNVEKITYITGNSETDPFDITPMFPKDNEDAPFLFKDELDDSNQEIKQGIINNEGDINENNNLEDDFNNRIAFKKGNGRLSLLPFWEFYIYFEKINANLLQNFTDTLNRAFSSEFEEDLTNNLTQNRLIEILQNEELLKKMRKSYQDEFKNLNRHGLMLMHRPLIVEKHIISNYTPQCCSVLSHFRNNLFNFSRSIDTPTILTGDIRMDQIDNSQYIHDIITRNKGIIFFQVPHHGSKTGWAKNKLDLFNESEGSQKIAAIQFGLGNTYKHPRVQVINDLTDADFTILSINQVSSFCYSFLF